MAINRRAFRFFMENAGYATPPGKVACAGELARAERYAFERGWLAEWQGDNNYADLGDHEYWCKDARRTAAGYHDDGEPCQNGRFCRICEHDHNVDVCTLRNEHGEVIASLGGIIDASRAYARVIEAELASEAMDQEARAINALETATSGS